MATPPTPDLLSEGDDSGAFKNDTNGRGKGKGRGKGGKKKSKKKTTVVTNNSDQSNGSSKANGGGNENGGDKGAPPPPQSTTSSNGANHGSKCVHDDDDDDDDDNDDGDECDSGLDLPSSQKKQRSTSSSSSSSSPPPSWNLRVVVMYLFFHALGVFVTVPLLFSSCATLGCGGGENLNRLVDMVLSEQSRRTSGSDESRGDDNHASSSSSSSLSLVELMEHLTVNSPRRDGMSRGGRGDEDDDDDDEIVRRGGRRRVEGGKNERGGGGSSNIIDSNDEVLLRSSSTDIIESMCHVASIAIAQFSLHLPYARWLVLRNPFAFYPPATTVEVDSPLPLHCDDRNPHKIGKSSSNERRGVLRRIMARRRAKNEERLRERGEQAAASSSSAASEGIDRVHPIRHILEGASIFSHHRKQKRLTEDGSEKNKRIRDGGGDNGNARVVDWKKWKYAMSDDYELGTEEIDLVRELARRVIVAAKDSARCPDDDANATDECNDGQRRIASFSGGSDTPHRPFHERVDGVPWGGISDDTTRWWPRKSRSDPLTTISAHSEGGRVLAAYLKIMKWPADLYPKFPFRLCPKGCGSEVSLLHTLEWREKYRPWCVSSETIRFNRAGFIYSRGHSNPGVNQRLRLAEKNGRSGSSEGHSLVWYRPGLASPSDDGEMYTRSIINVLDVAVSESLIRNRGTIGRFNIVMDCGGMSSRNSPTIAGAKRLFSILQDHYPDRLGVLLAANLSGLTQMLMKMMMPFVTEDVRAKIHIVPNGAEERREMLLQFMTEDEIPYYLGGKDDYKYDAKEYYRGKCVLPEDAIRDYITMMPYHA